jgi:hypothetical protein
MARRRRHTRGVHAPDSDAPRGRAARLPACPLCPRRSALALGVLVALVGSACLGARALRTTATRSVVAARPAATPSHDTLRDVTSDSARDTTRGAARDTMLEDDVPSAAGAPSSTDVDALAYAGRDAHHRPRYVQRAFTDDERRLLRDAFGITDPHRLWLPDSSATAVLRYDGIGGIAARVGYRSWRRPGETWEAFVARIRRLDRRAWPASARDSYHVGLAALAPDARPAFAELLDAARAAGFRVRVAETYRAPERQAYLLAHGNGKTFTATSAHQYGRAADILVGDGRIDTRRKVREWIRFRRWVLAWGAGRFRLVGTPNDTWDWPHVELADPPIGFRTVDELLAAARLCVASLGTSRDAADDDPCALPRDPGARATRLVAVARARHSITIGDARMTSAVSR